MSIVRGMMISFLNATPFIGSCISSSESGANKSDFVESGLGVHPLEKNMMKAVCFGGSDSGIEYFFQQMAPKLSTRII